MKSFEIGKAKMAPVMLIIAMAGVLLAGAWIGSGGLNQFTGGAGGAACYKTIGDQLWNVCGSVPFQVVGSPTVSAGVGLAPTSPPSSGVFTQNCPNDVLNMSIAARNVEDSTLAYLSAPMVAFGRNTDGSQGSIVGTVTTGGSGSIAYSGLNIPCKTQQNYDLVVLGNTTVGGGRLTFANDAIKQLEVPAWNTTEVPALIRDSALTNITTLGATFNYIIDPTSTAQTLGAGDSFAGFLDYKINVTGSRYGIPTDPVLNPKGIGYIVTANFSTSETTVDNIGLNEPVTHLKSVPCSGYDPMVAQAATATLGQACFVGDSFPTSAGLLRASVSLAFPLSNPSQDVSFMMNDVVYFQDTDGKIKAGAFNSASGNVGAAQTVATFTIS